MVTCDCASLDRLASLAGNAVRAKTLIWIDHHVTNEGLGSIPIVDPDATSTSELVWRLVRRLGGEVSIDTAKCLYAGLVTDTGRFQYEAVRPETLRLCGRAPRVPVRAHAARAGAVRGQRPAGPGSCSVALRRIRLEEDADLVWTYLTQGDLARRGSTGAGPTT